MTTQIKCSNCGGTKIEDTGKGRYRCLYCGETFQMESQNEFQQIPAQVSHPQVIVINQIPQSNNAQSHRQYLQKTKDEILASARRKWYERLVCGIISIILGCLFVYTDSFIVIGILFLIAAPINIGIGYLLYRSKLNNYQ